MPSPKIIKHAWFDFTGTLAIPEQEKYRRLQLETYANAVGRTLDLALEVEFDSLLQLSGSSVAAVFSSLGLGADYWSNRINSSSRDGLYHLAADEVPNILLALNDLIPISLFSNIRTEEILSDLGIDQKMFAHILGPDMLIKPKPSPEGFCKIIEISRLPPNQILYIGDNIEKDILPARKTGITTGLIWSKSELADFSFEQFGDILKAVRQLSRPAAA